MSNIKKNSPEFDLCFRLMEDLARNSDQWCETSYGVCRLKGKDNQAKIVIIAREEWEKGFFFNKKKVKKVYLTCPSVYTFEQAQADQLYDAVTAWRIKAADKGLAELIRLEIHEGGKCSSEPPLQSLS